MKYLVVSDLHLTEYDERKCNYLVNLFSNYENIFINGDLWTTYYDTFSHFVTSKWNVLFPILKSRNTIYLEGNHDPSIYTDERVFEFCNQHLVEYELTLGDLKYVIRHGHTYFPKKKKRKSENERELWRRFRLYNIRALVEKFVRGMFGPNAYLFFYGGLNKEIKKQKRLGNDRDKWLLTGHTHVSEFNIQEKYLNTGFINYGISTFAIITEDGPKFFTEEY